MTRIARANASWPAVASRPVRCGSSEVWIAWNSCSGARAISSTLNTIPASAALLEVASTVSTAAFSSVCSASMIPDTHTAKPPPRRSDSSSWAAASCTPSVPGPASAASASSAVIGPSSSRSCSTACAPARRAARSRRSRAKAAGTTTSETNGAAAMPSATAVWPLVMPSATAIAKQMRETDSISTSPPNSAKHWCPASQPRAK